MTESELKRAKQHTFLKGTLGGSLIAAILGAITFCVFASIPSPAVLQKGALSQDVSNLASVIFAFIFAIPTALLIAGPYTLLVGFLASRLAVRWALRGLRSKALLLRSILIGVVASILFPFWLMALLTLLAAKAQVPLPGGVMELFSSPMKGWSNFYRVWLAFSVIPGTLCGWLTYGWIRKDLDTLRRFRVQGS